MNLREYLPWELLDSDTDDGPQTRTAHAYHSKAHLPDERESLLIDPGAFDNLTSSAWVKRQAAIAEKHGYKVDYYDLGRTVKVAGVGKLH